MINNVFIHAGDVDVLGEEEQYAAIVVDLSKVWQQILNRYTTFYVIGHLQVPILVEAEEGYFIRQVMHLRLSQVFQVNEVIDQQVTLKTVYSGMIQEDPTRIPRAEVELIAYLVEEVEGKGDA